MSKSKKLGLVKVALSGEIRFSGSKENHEAAGFEKLNICFECLDDKSNLQARWHVDLANISDMQEESQEGPVFHIQFGGNSATNEDRSLDFKLDRPRWMYPPIDFILACEIVVANFFPDEWRELRKNVIWNSIIRDSEKFCLKPYFEKVASDMNATGNGTLLGKLWSK